eukprot:626871-Rhodomonas_salina.1
MSGTETAYGATPTGAVADRAHRSLGCYAGMLPYLPTPYLPTPYLPTCLRPNCLRPTCLRMSGTDSAYRAYVGY